MIKKFSLYLVISLLLSCAGTSDNSDRMNQQEWITWYRDRMATDTHLISEFNRQLRDPNLEDHEKISILWELYENTANNWHKSERPK